jgi:hypothetical protein
MPDYPIKLQAAMFLMHKTTMSIIECQHLAKDMELSTKMTFELVGPKGRKSCKWLDAYCGLFEMEGFTDSFHIRQFQYAWDVHVENVAAEE